jgi:hypothetical protein
VNDALVAYLASGGAVLDHPTPKALVRYLTGVLDSDGASACRESEAVDSGDVVYDVVV